MAGKKRKQSGDHCCPNISEQHNRLDFHHKLNILQAHQKVQNQENDPNDHDHFKIQTPAKVIAIPSRRIYT